MAVYRLQDSFSFYPYTLRVHDPFSVYKGVFGARKV